MHEDTTNSEIQYMMAGIGHFVTQWAFVEMNLSALAHHLLGSDDELTDALWTRVRSFDNKLQILCDLADIKIKDEVLRRDWKLLNSPIKELYSIRNKIVHSLPGFTQHSKPSLEPGGHFTSKQKGMIEQADLNNALNQAIVLSDALIYLIEKIEPDFVEADSAKPLPELIVCLRAADEKKRDVQRHKSKAWREYQERNPELKFE